MRPANIGPFRVESELGRGGMGVVYLATDSRLDRPVAIKALPADVASDPERLARFQREAKVLASLNHPSIAAIYGLEQVDGRQYLVLEYIEGETLSARLKRGPVPLGEALPIAEQIAEALEAAHEKGIVHRDLKPGNIMLAESGRAKVLDFGLASSVGAAPSSSMRAGAIADSPTVTSPMMVHSPTIPGVIMGTAGYMSPEQARGKVVDKRSDIFAFGCVLYEMLTGEQPFAGETITDSLAAVLHRAPPLDALPSGTPARVRTLLSRCLEKDRARRLRDIGDAALELESAIGEPPDSAAPPRPRGRRRAAALLALSALILALGAVIGRYALRSSVPPPSAPVLRYTIDPPAGFTLPEFSEGFAAIALSPAGDTIVFPGEADGVQRLFARDVSSFEARELPGTENASTPSFSPDGRWITYFVGGRLVKAPISGGTGVSLCESGSCSAAWLDDGTILLAKAERGLWRLNGGGGTPTLLAKCGPDVRTATGDQLVLGFNRVERVPGASYALASVWDGDTIEDYSVVAVSLSDGSVRPLIRNATDARFVAPDTVIFLRGSTLMAVPIDVESGAVRGEPRVALDGVRVTRWADSAYAAVSVSGTLAYVPGGRPGPGRRLVSVDQSGKSAPLMDNTEAIVGGMRVSPDGERVAVITLRRKVELWSYDLRRRAFSLVNARGESWSPAWSADGRSLYFFNVVPGSPPIVAHKSLDGALSQAPFEIPAGLDAFPNSSSPDGTTLLLNVELPGMNRRFDVHAVKLEAGAKSVPLIESPASEGDPVYSPDGRWIAYLSDESGRREVYISAVSGSGKRVQVSTEGGYTPRWSRDGKRVFYLDRRDAMQSSTVELGENPHASPPVKLFDTEGVATTSLWGEFDVLPGDSFLMVEPAPWEVEPRRLHVVVNWGAELKGT